MSGGVLQPAGPCDVAVLAELYQRCFVSGAEEAFAGTPWSARSLAEVMALPGVFGLLALEDEAPAGAPAGFLLAQVLFEEAELLTLGVLPACRRSGLGRRLLAAGLAEAGRRGARRMTLEVAADNGAAQALYRTAGFREAGRRRNYYRKKDGGSQDALILSRPLEGPEEPAALS